MDGPQGNLSDYECSVLKEAFALFDLNHNGVIEPEEFVSILTRLGCKTTRDEVIDLLGMHETARITYPMFLQMYQHDEREDLVVEAEEALKELTGQGDTEEITPALVQKFLKNLNLELTNEEAKLCCALGDEEGDKDGKFGKDDFLKQYAKK